MAIKLQTVLPSQYATTAAVSKKHLRASNIPTTMSIS